MKFSPPRMIKKLTLRTKMVLGGIIILLIPIIVIGTVTFIKTSQISENTVKKEFVQIAKSLSGVIQIALKKNLGMINSLALDPLIVREVTLGRKNIIRKKLAELYEIVQSDYEGIAIVDKDGIIYIDGTDISREGISISDRKYYNDAKEGKSIIGSVVLSKATRDPVFVLIAPILSPKKEFLGGVIGVVKIGFLLNFISSIKIGETGYAYMFNREGIILSHPDKNNILKLNIHNKKGLENLIKNLKHNPFGTAEYTYRGKIRIGGFAPVELTGWTIEVGQGKEEVMALAYGNMKFILLISGFFVLLTILAVFVFSGKLSTPVQTKLTFLSHALDQAMEAVQAGVWDASPAKRTIYLSPQWFAMLGYPPQDNTISFEELNSFFHPEDQPGLYQQMKKYISSGGHEPIEMEFRLRRADGTWCWFLSKSNAIAWDKKGMPERIIGLDVNIQNIKDAQIKLAQSDARFRMLFKMAPVPMAHIALDGRILDVNNRLTETMGHTNEDVRTLEHAWKLSIPDPDIREQVTSKWRCDLAFAIENNSQMEPVECQLHYMDGTSHTVIVETELIGESIIVSFFDITERRQAKEAVEFERQQLLSIFNNLNEFIYVSDPLTYEILFANKRLCDLIGKDPKGAPCYKEIQGLDKPCDFCTNDIILNNGGRPYKWEHHNSAINVDVEIVDQIIKWPDGRDVRFEFAVDITERKRAEVEREKLQEQLLQAQKLEAVGTLAGGVAHDFNNMLGAIMGYAELALNKMDPADPSRKNLNKILDVAQRSANITRQLLAFARKQTIQPVVMDLNESIEATLKMLRRLIDENIELAWLPASEPCNVKIDPSQLDQILVNLCVNAKDAITNVGRITIETEAISFDKAFCESHPDFIPGKYALLAMSDDGCGMDKETMKHIFEPFFTTKGLGKGTGMGLATVYGIVKQNKGFINAYSELGKGTIFKIYIPMTVEEAVKSQQEADDTIPESKGETILLVEDDPILLEMAIRMLESLNYSVLSTDKPNEAVRIAKENMHEIDLLITDVVMPEMSGRHLADTIQTIQPKVKCIFMSGYTADVIAHQGILDEDIFFLQKPFSTRDLALKVREALDG